MPDLRALLERLIEHEVDFVLIGGFAAVVHGSTLVTQDLDVCAAITEPQVAKLREALRDLRPWHRMNRAAKLSFLEHPQDFRGTNNIYLQTDLGVLDILSEAQPVGDFSRIKSQSVEISIYGQRCRVISIEDLIQIKASMKRPKDLQAVQELEIIRSRSKT